MAKRDAAQAIQELRRAVTSGERKSFYLLHGDEDFGRDRQLRWLEEALAPEAPDFNRSVFHGDRFAATDFLRGYNSYPMMAAHRLLVLKDCDRLPVADCRDLEPIVDFPSETSIVIAVGAKLDLRRRLFQQMASKGHAIEFRPPFDNQVGPWIHRFAREQKIAIEPEAVDLLQLYIGNNLRELAGEIDKVQTYLGPGQPITASAVSETVAVSEGGDVFALADAAGSGDYPRCQRLLHELLTGGEDPARILAMVVRHFKLLLRARQFMATSGNSRNGLASHLGVAPFFVESYARQARNQAPDRLWKALSALLLADGRLKSLGRRQQTNTMAVLLHALCSGDSPSDRGRSRSQG